MIKYQLKYGIQLSLDTINTEEYKSIVFTLEHPKAKEYFVPSLKREIGVLTGYHGHLVSVESMTIPNFVKAMNDLDDRWQPELIEGSNLADLPIGQIPSGTTS